MEPLQHLISKWGAGLAMTSKEQRKQWEAEQKLLASLAVLEDDLDWSCPWAESGA